jgi:hypothetical protein
LVKFKLSFAVLLITLNLCAQQYSVDWYKIAGGGGTSSNSNGQYSASGTIGQPDASSAMSGGNYSLTGGFWSLISVVQMPGAPTLTITHSGGNVMVSWPSPSMGFVLQQNSDLTAANWTTSGFAISSNSATMSITITSPPGNLFFRLKN